MFFPYIIISDCDKWFWVQIYGKLKNANYKIKRTLLKQNLNLFQIIGKTIDTIPSRYKWNFCIVVSFLFA